MQLGGRGAAARLQTPTSQSREWTGFRVATTWDKAQLGLCVAEFFLLLFFNPKSETGLQTRPPLSVPDLMLRY